MNRIKEIRKEIKILRSEIKKEERLSKKDTPSSIVSWFTKKRDRLVFSLKDRIDQKAGDIVYRNQDPRGWEATQLIRAAEPLVKALVAKSNKGKKISERNRLLCGKIKIALLKIEGERIGRDWETARRLAAMLEPIVPSSPEYDKVTLGLLDMMQDFGAKIEGLTGQKMPTLDFQSFLATLPNDNVEQLLEEVIEENKSPAA